ncbi:hypothetical protein Tco_0137256, partial [Tanacetum coccineum]
MAQQQHAADVHPDELCPPNKRYDLSGRNNNKVGMRIPAWMSLPKERIGHLAPLDHLTLLWRQLIQSREEQEARENMALVYEHLAAEEIEKLVE